MASQTPPVPSNFHPSESETIFSLNPTAEEFVVDIQGPDELGPILGKWTSDGFEKGDLSWATRVVRDATEATDKSSKVNGFISSRKFSRTGFRT